MIKKERSRKMKEVTTVDYKYHCDMCKNEYDDDTRGYAVDDFKLEWSEGAHYSYEEGGHQTVLSVDICPKCRENFFELLKKNGIRVNEIEDIY
jgi:Zn finger protein HypA/HybF involved in hydrogenase expression